MKTTIDERTVHTNFQEILDAPFSRALTYAIPYARAGLQMTGQELRIQVLYVLGSITYWRGEQAKRIRQNLKDF